MADNSSSNKRIAKNTLLLYARMLYSLFISLFTARIILNALGFEDYGLYNVIGSIVAMFVFLRSAMGNSTHRYITYAIGKGDFDNIQKVFSLSVIIFTALAILIVLLCETVGLWFFYEKLNIPDGRMTAAFWVYQFSIITTAITVICVPYDAIIIAHERMNIFAFVQVLSSTLSLGTVYLVKISPFDKLILYAFLLFLIQVINRVIYGIYCGRHFPETKFKFIKDWSLMKEMTSFAGWSLIGNLIWVGYTQGVNIMLNIFFGPAVNAARGIAVQVQNAMSGFVTNFQTALNPQIIKSYARKDFKRQLQLLYSSSKFSYFLTLCMVLPVFVEADGILVLWLREVPDYTTAFLRLILLISLISPLENPIGISNNATGDIKKYQLTVGCFNIFIFILAFVALKLGYEPYSVFIVQFVISAVVLFVKLLLVKDKIQLSLRDYFSNVLLKILIVTIIASMVPITIHYFKPTNSVIGLLLNCAIGAISAAICSYFIGMNSQERAFILNNIKQFFEKFRRK